MAETRNTENKDIKRTKVEKRFFSLFTQASWRSRVRTAGSLLVGLVIVLLVASVYLSISGEAASAGLDAYYLNLERMELERKIADTNANIAVLTSVSNMEQRARDMGFARVDPADAVYIKIPGSPGRQTVAVAAPIDNTPDDRLFVRSIYRQSLWDWLFSGINNLSDTFLGENN